MKTISIFALCLICASGLAQSIKLNPYTTNQSPAIASGSAITNGVIATSVNNPTAQVIARTLSSSVTLALDNDTQPGLQLAGGDFGGGGAFLTGLNAGNIASGTLGAARLPQQLSITNGIASFSTISAVAINSTGWTNIWSTNNATVYVSATAVAFTVKNRANATIYTSPTLTTTVTVTLQPGWAVSAASGLAGTAVPW